MRRVIEKFLTSFPKLRKKLRKYRQLASFSFSRKRGDEAHVDSQVRLLTPWDWAGVPYESGELFFGYYDKSPWNQNGNRMLFHFRKKKANRRLEIRIFDKEEKKCWTVGESQAWNFQQGTMAQWLRGLKDERIIFNDIIQDKLVARMVSIHGDNESIISLPIQTVHPNGREALTLNYRRFLVLRPDYGYSTPVENFSPFQPLDRDGIWRVDLTTGEGELIVSLEQLHAIEPRKEMNPEKTQVNHIIFSPTGTRCVFMHRWFYRHVMYSRLYIMDWSSKNLHLLLDTQMISHYHWFDDDHLIVYGRVPENRDTYFLINVVDGSYRVLAEDLFERFGDGHPSFSPDRRWIVTDTYPDLSFKQHLLLYNLQANRLWEVGNFIYSPRYFGMTRCDLHPRWSPDGLKVSIDSVWKGFRSSYILDVSSIVGTPSR